MTEANLASTERKVSGRDAQRKFRNKIKEAGGIQFAGELKSGDHVRKLDAVKDKYELRSRKAAVEYILTSSLDKFKG